MTWNARTRIRARPDAFKEGSRVEALLAPRTMMRFLERLFPGRSAVRLTAGDGRQALLLELFPADRTRLQRRRLPAGTRRLGVSGSVEGEAALLLWPVTRQIPDMRVPPDGVEVFGAGALSGKYQRDGSMVLRAGLPVAAVSPPRATMQPASAPVFDVALSLVPRKPEGGIDAMWMPPQPRLLAEAIERIASPDEKGAGLGSIRVAQAAQGIILVADGGPLPSLTFAQPLQRSGRLLIPRGSELTPSVDREELDRALGLGERDVAVVIPRGSGIAVSTIRQFDLMPLSSALRAGTRSLAEPATPAAEAWSHPFGAVLGGLSRVEEILRPLDEEIGAQAQPVREAGLFERVRRQVGRRSLQSPVPAKVAPRRHAVSFLQRMLRRVRARKAPAHPDAVPAKALPARAGRPGFWSRLLGRGTPVEREKRPVPVAPRPDSILRRASQALAKALFDRFRFLRERALGRHGARLAEVLSLFRQGKLEEALKRAVPLSDGLGGGTEPFEGPPGLPPPPRDGLDFRLSDLLLKKGALATLAVGPSVFDELRQSYKRAAERLLAQGRHRAAAYVYAVLLDDARAAGEALAKGGSHREAAIVFLEKAGDRHRAARELAACADFHRAADLAERCNEFELAAEYLSKAGDGEAERACLNRWAKRLATDGRYLAAGRVYEERLHEPAFALNAYRSGMSDLSEDSHLFALTAAMRCHLRLGKADEAVTEARRAVENLLRRGETRRLATDYDLLATLGSQIESVRALPGTGASLARALDSLVRRSLATATVGLARLSARARAEDVGQALERIAAGRLDRLLSADVRGALAVLPEPARRPSPRGLSATPTQGEVIHTLGASRDGTLFAGASDRRMHVFSTVDNWTCRTMDGAGYSILGCAVDPEATVAIALNTDGSLLSFELETGRKLGSVPPAVTAMRALAPTIAGGLAWAGDWEGRLFGLRPPLLETALEIPVSGAIKCLAADAEGRLLAVGTEALVAVYDVSGRPPRPVRTLGFERPLAVAFSASGRMLCVAGSRVSVFSWPEGQAGPAAQLTEVALDSGNGWTRAVAFSPDGRTVACGGFDRVVRVFDTEGGKLVSEHRLHRAEILALCFLPDGSIVSSDARGGAVVVHPDGPRFIRNLVLGP